MKKFKFLTAALCGAVMSFSAFAFTACAPGNGSSGSSTGNGGSSGSGMTITADTDPQTIVSEVLNQTQWKAALQASNTDNFSVKTFMKVERPDGGFENEQEIKLGQTMMSMKAEINYDGATTYFNNTSIVSRVYKEDGKKVMFLGDAGDEVATKLILYYGDYLQSEICQASHHGVENFTIEAYRLIRSADWLYPCSTSLYNLTNRDAEVRAEIRNAEYTKNIYLHDGAVRPVISLNNNDPTKANRSAILGGGLVGRVDADAGNDDMVVIFEDCIVDGKIAVSGPCYFTMLGGILSVGYNGWGSADSFSSDFVRIYFKNILASVDFDISEIDYSRTPEQRQYAKLAGIAAYRGSGYISMEDCHYTGALSGVGDDFKGAKTCVYGGMVADGAGELSNYKNCTTSLDRMMTKAAQYDEDETTIIYEENWFGQFENCQINAAEPAGLRENILSNIENGYDNDDVIIEDTAAIWDGSVAIGFSGGAGTKTDPYQITYGSELAYISNRVNGGTTFEGVYFKLMNDIDMGGNAIEPIGNSYNYRYFSGIFDGNGKTVSNLSYDTQTAFNKWGDVCVGLFGHVRNALICNLTVDGDEIVAQGGFFAGTIVGMAVNSEINGCTNNADFTVSVLDAETQTSIYVGGIVGFAVDGTDIINCINNGKITATGRHTENGHIRSAVIVGGIVGRCDNDLGTDEKTFTIKNCINSGDIVVTGKTWFVYVGGILGFFHNGWLGSDSYSGSWVGVQFENVLFEGNIDVTTVDIGADSGKTNNIEIGGIVCNTSKTCGFKNVSHNGAINSIAEGDDPQLGSVMIAGIAPNGRTKNNHESVTTSFDKFTFNAAEYNDDGSLKNPENKKGIYDENCFTGITDTSAVKSMILAEIENATALPGGKLTDTMTWEYDPDYLTLTISGAGEMPDFDTLERPWEAYRDAIMTVVIEDGITSIGNKAFYDHAFTSVTIPNSVTTIGEFAFLDCKLTSITVDENNANYKSVNGVLYSKDGKTLIQYPASKSDTSYVIPDGVTTIFKSAFENSDNLTSITIPNSVTSIGDFAFRGSDNLISITIPNDVTRIGSQIFMLCGSLKNVVIPSSVTTIAYNAFCDCSSLETIIYCGTEEQWNNITKETDWDTNAGEYAVQYHSFDNGVISTEPTHTTYGVKIYTCTVCSETKTEPVDKLTAHEWGEGTVTTDPTHTTEGVKTYTCACGETKTEPVEKLPEHEWDEGAVTTDPTHTTEGVRTYTCPCGETRTESVEKLPEHEWDEGAVTTAPTYTKEGIRTYTCTCGATKTESVPVLEIGPDTPTISIDSKTVAQGSTFKISVMISNNPGVVSMYLNLIYDTEVLELLSVEDEGLLKGNVFGQSFTSPYAITWDDSTASGNNTANGNLVTLTFKVKDEAKLGTTAVSISYNVGNIIDFNLKNVDFAIIDGVITIVDYTPGDVNMDGEVNAIDVAFVRRHLAGWEDYQEISVDAADVNKDGDVNATDVALLRRYLAKWDGIVLR